MGNTTKFTPGPWWRVYNTNKERGVKTTAGFICFLPKPNHYTGQDERYDDEQAEVEANQNLIAAAPDLYGALSGCAATLFEAEKQFRQRGDIGHASLCEHQKRIANQALAKARGEKSE